MDEERIGLVLDKASELRLKITNCIQNASTNNANKDELKTSVYKDSEADEEEEDDEKEEQERLLNIRDALEALEAQLSSLLALQQQQWYEIEAGLAEIKCSQKKLLKKLKKYKGKDMEVIHEATAFVGETVDDNNGLLLPLYPSRPSCSAGSDNSYLSNFTSTCKFPQNGVISNGGKDEFSKSVVETERNHTQPNTRSPLKGIKLLIPAAAKTAFTVVGVICVLSLVGFEPRLGKRQDHLKVFSLFHLPEIDDEKGTRVTCPPGKIPVMEDGTAFVKERVEIPFESAVLTPDVNWGRG